MNVPNTHVQLGKISFQVPAEVGGGSPGVCLLYTALMATMPWCWTLLAELQPTSSICGIRCCLGLTLALISHHITSGLFLGVSKPARVISWYSSCSVSCAGSLVAEDQNVLHLQRPVLCPGPPAHRFCLTTFNRMCLLCRPCPARVTPSASVCASLSLSRVPTGWEGRASMWCGRMPGRVWRCPPRPCTHKIMDMG